MLGQTQCSLFTYTAIIITIVRVKTLKQHGHAATVVVAGVTV